MRVMTDTEVAWLAGLIEGEGYFSISKKGHISLGVNMCDLDIIERLREVTGEGLIYSRKVYVPNHSPSWSWKVAKHDEVQAIARTIRPWMGARRQARIDQVLAVQLIRREPLMGSDRLSRALALLDEGRSQTFTAREIGVSRGTLRRALIGRM